MHSLTTTKDDVIHVNQGHTGKD